MQQQIRPQTFGERENAFGFLRLLLASLVIVSHTPELLDGNRHRELLTMAFGSISFGEFAVDGFFVVSGFLIAGSALRSSSPWSYLTKRAARIYPAFVLASLFCMILVAPLSGGRPEHSLFSSIAGTVVRMALLAPPALHATFAGSPYPLLNQAAWTLQYEFLCYLLVVVAAYAGLLRTARGAAAIAIIGLATYSALYVGLSDLNMPLTPDRALLLQGRMVDLPRLVGLFFTGAAIFVVRHRIVVKASWAAISSVGLAFSLYITPLAHPGFAIFGSYLLFALAIWGGGNALARVNRDNDISYGLYLYAWPIEKLFIWWGVSDSLFVLGGLTWALAACAGWASWILVERRVAGWVNSISDNKKTARAIA